MQGTQVVYNGRSIAKEGFRAFIYGSNGIKKLVNGWDEFEAHMATGVWFSSIEQVPVIQAADETEPELKKEQHKKRSK